MMLVKKSISFSVPGLPVAQPRQRHRIVAAHGRQFTQNYTPAKAPVNAFKAAVRDAAARVYGGPPLQGAIRLHLTFLFPRPKALIWKSRPMSRVPKVSKPDWDNLGKSVCDALTGLLWGDDAQVFCPWVEKWIAAGDEQPRTLVCVEEVEV